MDKTNINISTVRRRIENILIAYDKQKSASTALETSTSSGNSTGGSDDKEKAPFSYETIDIESILKMTDRKIPRTNRRKRVPLSQSNMSPKDSRSSDEASQIMDEHLTARSLARQRSKKESVSSINIESRSDYDETNRERDEAQSNAK